VGQCSHQAVAQLGSGAVAGAGNVATGSDAMENIGGEELRQHRMKKWGSVAHVHILGC
jgi:hypothetical protein